MNEEASARVAGLVKTDVDAIPRGAKEQSELIARLTKDVNLADDTEILFYYERDENTNVIYPAYPIALYKQVELNGDDIAHATEDRDDMGRPAVSFNTTQQGALKFSEVTSKKNHGKRLAIVIDEKVRSAPALNVQIMADGHYSGQLYPFRSAGAGPDYQ